MFYDLILPVTSVAVFGVVLMLIAIHLIDRLDYCENRKVLDSIFVCIGIITLCIYIMTKLTSWLVLTLTLN